MARQPRPGDRALVDTDGNTPRYSLLAASLLEDLDGRCALPLLPRIVELGDEKLDGPFESTAPRLLPSHTLRCAVDFRRTPAAWILMSFVPAVRALDRSTRG